MSLGKFALDKTVVVVSLTIVLFIVGIFSFLNLSRLEDPEFTIKEAKVITLYPGARPMEVEKEVTDKLEVAIQQLGQLKKIKSESREGISIITPVCFGSI